MIIIIGTTYNGNWDGWYGSSSWSMSYDVNEVLESPAGLAVAALGIPITSQSIEKLRDELWIDCGFRNSTLTQCQPLKKPCLFNILQDPCEYNNLAEL